MGPLVYTLLMLGCADDGSACHKIDFAAQTYEAASQCRADIPTALRSDTALRADYPSVEARCVPVRITAKDIHHDVRQLARR